MHPVLIICVLIVLAVFYIRYRRKKLYLRRVELIDQFRFPQKVYMRVQQQYPHLSKVEVETVIEGLREYFYISLLANKNVVAMPSQVIDVAWHEFILFTREYERFCSQSFARFLHHTPAEAMSSPTMAQTGIKRAWRLACFREGIDPQAPSKLPLIFAIDEQLKIPDGFSYQLDCKGLANNGYCASHIGCGGGCSGSSEGGSDSGCSGGGD